VRSAVDSSVLLDVFSRSERFFETSQAALRRALMEGSLLACEVVWAEVRAHFPAQKEFNEALATLGVFFDSLDEQCASWRVRPGRDTAKRVDPDSVSSQTF
jgi:predicted nucleic acid-binding protein